MKKNFALLCALLIFSAGAFAANGKGAPTSSTPDTTVQVSEVYPAASTAKTPTVAPLNTSIYIAFSEPLSVTAMADMLTLTDAAGKIFTVTATPVASGVIFTPTTPLTASSTITAKFTDDSDMAAPYSWSFNTSDSADTGLPAVTATTPRNGSSYADPTQPIVVNFSKKMNPASFTAANVTINDSYNNPVAGAVTFNFDKSQMIFTAGQKTLGVGLTITAVLGAVEDMDGNTLAKSYTLSFNTANGGAESYVSANSYSFTVPTNVTGLNVFTYGANGGDGSACGAGIATSGDAGDYNSGYISVYGGEVITVVVGAGGSGGIDGTSGYEGGNTYVIAGGVAQVIASGGYGGVGEIISSGGSSGVVCSAGVSLAAARIQAASSGCSSGDSSGCSSGGSTGTSTGSSGGTSAGTSTGSSAGTSAGTSTGTSAGTSTGTSTGTSSGTGPGSSGGSTGGCVSTGTSGGILYCTIGWGGSDGYATITWSN